VFDKYDFSKKKPKNTNYTYQTIFRQKKNYI